MELINMLQSLTSNQFVYKMNKFDSIVANHEDIKKYVDLSKCIEFCSYNGQEVCIYTLADDNKLFCEYSCCMTKMFDRIVITEIYNKSGLVYSSGNYDNLFENVKRMVGE